MTLHADTDLGKILLEQKPNKGNIGNAIFLIVLGLPMMFVVAAPNAPLGVRFGFFGLGFSLSGFAAIMLWRNWMHVFLQETGVREYRQRRARSLPYEQVDEILYSSLRIFAHGSYIHTVQKLAMKSSRRPGPPLVCTLIFKEADGRASSEARTPIVEVRDRIARRLADEFLTRLQRERSIEWTPEVRISKHGLEVADPQGNWQQIEWSRISRRETSDLSIVAPWDHRCPK